jgi:hypothetical protein
MRRDERHKEWGTGAETETCQDKKVRSGSVNDNAGGELNAEGNHERRQNAHRCSKSRNLLDILEAKRLLLED